MHLWKQQPKLHAAGTITCAPAAYVIRSHERDASGQSRPPQFVLGGTMIVLTQQEVQALMAEFSKMPYGQVAGVVNFFAQKVQQMSQAQAAAAPEAAPAAN